MLWLKLWDENLSSPGLGGCKLLGSIIIAKGSELKLGRHSTSLQSHSSHLCIDVLSSWQCEPKPWIQTITIEWHLDVGLNGGEATDCITKVTQCPWKSKKNQPLVVTQLTYQYTVQLPEKQTQELYCCTKEATAPFCSQSDRQRSHQLCLQVDLPIFASCLQKPTLSHLGAVWEPGLGITDLTPDWPRGDMNVLPDPLCPAAACDITYIPDCKQRHIPFHCYEVIHSS